MVRVFISHASVDENIAQRLQELLVMGLELKSSDFFCSSLPGRQVEGGYNYIEKIKAALNNAEVVILLLTKNYFDSIFCIAEAGACWISEKNAIPVLVEPVTYDDLKATLSQTQGWKINKRSDLESLADDIINKLELRNNPLALSGHAMTRFLNDIPGLIKQQKLYTPINQEEFIDMENRIKSLIKENDALQKELAEKRQLITSLEKLKKQEEVYELKLKKTYEIEKFENLCASICMELRKLDTIVSDAIYYYIKDDQLPIPAYGDTIAWEEIRKNVDMKYLLYNEDDRDLKLNNNHKKILELLDRIDELEIFMNDSCGVNTIRLAELVEDKTKCTFDLSDKIFWNTFCLSGGKDFF